jgi:hypothetical protein
MYIWCSTFIFAINIFLSIGQYSLLPLSVRHKGEGGVSSPILTRKKIENPYKDIEWKLYGTLLEIEWILMIHNNCIFPYYGYSIEIVWIYYGFSGFNCKFHSMDFTSFSSVFCKFLASFAGALTCCAVSW